MKIVFGGKIMIYNFSDCTTVKEIHEKENKILETLRVEHKKKMDSIETEHKKKMDLINCMKAKHDAELDIISKEIKEAIASKNFNLVKDLLLKQTEISAKQNEEMLSVM